MAEMTPTQLQEPDPVRRPARLALYVGGALVIVGLVVLYLGYNGAATNALPQAQTPYVISGGLLGVALMMLGGIAVAVYVLLQVQGDLRTELRSMREAIEQSGEAMARDAHSNGTSSNGHATVMVSRGASSFHRPECRLVVRAGAATPVPREQADDSGLVPCRICKP